MSDVTRNYVFHEVEDNSPEQLERDRWLTDALLKRHPEWRRPFEDAGGIAKARSDLRRVLARRGLALPPADDARIDACTDAALLERWLDEAVVAKTAAEVFGSPARKPRAAPKRQAR